MKSMKKNIGFTWQHTGHGPVAVKATPPLQRSKSRNKSNKSNKSNLLIFNNLMSVIYIALQKFFLFFLECVRRRISQTNPQLENSV